MSSRWRSSFGSEQGRAPTALVFPLVLALAGAITGCTVYDRVFHRSPAAAAPQAQPVAVKPAEPAKPAPAAKSTAAPAAEAAKPVPAAPAARIAFDHQFHVGRGAACLDCHEGAEKTAKAGMPSLEFCMDCHTEIDEKKPKEKTIASFLDASGKPQWSHVTAQAGTIVFSHATHAAKKIDCKDCHKGIEESKAVTKELFVDMDACTQCHAQKRAKNECATCHSDAEGGGLKPDNHRRMWTTLHGQVVRRGAPETRAENCSLCHTESSCKSCHATEAPRDHSTSWRVDAGHGIAASLDRARCAACHTSDTCESCHSTVEPRNHRGGWGAPRNRHCVGCHLPLSRDEPGGCGVCHKGTPSHQTAPRMPSRPPHAPDQQCRTCHDRKLKHVDNGTNCLACHR